MSRIEVREEKKDRYWALRIDPVFDPENTKRGFQPKVTTFADMDYSVEDHNYHWRRAEVSWFSIGSCGPGIAEAYARAIAICSEKARQMDAEHKFQDAPGPAAAPTVTIELCSWCFGRPVSMTGAERIPPGLHDAKLQISHGMCIPCSTKFSQGIGAKGGATQNGTTERDNTTEVKG
jgi:hypothetical protein